MHGAICRPSWPSSKAEFCFRHPDPWTNSLPAFAPPHVATSHILATVCCNVPSAHCIPNINALPSRELDVRMRVVFPEVVTISDSKKQPP